MIQAILTGLIIALLAGILAVADGAVIAQAFIAGAASFAGGVTLVLAIQKAMAA